MTKAIEANVVLPTVTVELEQAVPSSHVSGYRQKLAFPLLASKAGPPLPLTPVFAVFEDPEYNRALVSQTAHSEGIFVDNASPRVVHRIRLSLDRREYNPGSSFYAVYVDSVPLVLPPPPNPPVPVPPVPLTSASLLIQAISPDGSAQPLTTITLNLAALSSELNIAALYQAKGIQPVPGDSFSCTLKSGDVEVATVRADIVSAPVTPAPQAAYALLRKNGSAAECLRFAWSPAASAIELVNPDDLLGETVRRRAVFSWLATDRPQRDSQYAIQKITTSGSTHSIEDNLWLTPG